jgi:hypothetical protein
VRGERAVDLLPQGDQPRAHRLEVAQRVESDVERVAHPRHGGQQVALAQAFVEEGEDVVGPAAGVREGVAVGGVEIQPAAAAQGAHRRGPRRLREPVENLLEVTGGERRAGALDQRLQHRRPHEEVARGAPDQGVEEGIDRLQLAHRGQRLDLLRRQPAGPFGEAIPAPGARFFRFVQERLGTFFQDLVVPVRHGPGL